MRFIDRRRMRPPDILRSKRSEDARAEVHAFINEAAKEGETRRLPDTSWLDTASEFKEQMETLFHGNCAYCEKGTLNRSVTVKPSYIPRPDGVIGRHRPEALAQNQSGSTDFLSYAWLTFEWNNLLWICSTCQRTKGNRFYIGGSRGEPFSSVKDLREAEQELLLDPCFHDPAEHLSFRIDGKVNWTSPIGEATCDVLDLNRVGLVSGRATAIAALARNLRDGPVRRSRPTDGTVVISAGRGVHGLQPHCGAATQAIVSFARYRGMDVGSADDFVGLLDSLPRSDRDGFIDDLLNETTRLQAPKEGLDPIPEAVQQSAPAANRIPDVQTLPNAQRPITRVEISNFKALRTIAFDLPETVDDPEQSPCMLLLGENATGKSSVLEAMALAILGAEETEELNKLVGDTAITPQGLIHRPDPSDWTQTMDAVQVRLGFLDSASLVTLEGAGQATTFTGADRCAKVILGYGPRRFFTSRKSRRLRAPAHRVKSMFDPLDVIANPIHWLSALPDPQFYPAARALREVLMLSRDDDFERDDDPDTSGHIYIRHGGQRVAMQDLSVGFKSVIAMTCDIIREMLYHYDNLEFASAVVFIDEIETHLHPRWKMQIMTLLRRAFPKIQFIVTTHDPLCLRGMYDGEVFVLRRSDETDHVERVEDLPSIRGMRAEQILTSEFFGLGSTDPETDARLTRYNRLAARIEDLTEAERAEMERLRHQLDDGMVIGTTLREQAYAEALKERTAARSIAPTKVPSPRRAALKSEFANLFERQFGK